MAWDKLQSELDVDRDDTVRGFLSGSNPDGVARHPRRLAERTGPRPRCSTKCASFRWKSVWRSPTTPASTAFSNAVACNVIRPAGSPAVIVDTGTATTVDAISADGAFEGGAILPGFELCARALHQYTDLLPFVTVDELSNESHEPLGTQHARSAAQRSALGADRCDPRAWSERLSGRWSAAPFVLLDGRRRAAGSPELPEARWEPSLSLQGLAVVAEHLRNRHSVSRSSLATPGGSIRPASGHPLRRSGRRADAARWRRFAFRADLSHWTAVGLASLPRRQRPAAWRSAPRPADFRTVGRTTPPRTSSRAFSTQTLEIHCHGGEAAALRILRDCEQAGCRVVPWPEMAKVALGLLEAELLETLARGHDAANRGDASRSSRTVSCDGGRIDRVGNGQEFSCGRTNRRLASLGRLRYAFDAALESRAGGPPERRQVEPDQCACWVTHGRLSSINPERRATS